MKKPDKQDIENIQALTPAQEGLLYHYLKEPESENYFEQLNLGIAGEIDRVLFEKAWHLVVETNEMLHAGFRWEKMEKPLQIIFKEHHLDLRFHDLSDLDNCREKRALDEIKTKDWSKGFDLNRPPFRVILCKTAEKEYEMIISNHHILYDGWSNGIILKELFRTYHALRSGKQSIKPPIKQPFKEFVKWNQNRDRNEQEKFWKRYLEGFENLTELSIKKKNNGGDKRCENHSVIFEVDSKDKLYAFVKGRRVTLASVFYSAWGILLQKYCINEDVIFGTTVSGRSAQVKGIEEMVGLFINTIPLRVQTYPGDKIMDVVSRIDKVLRTREEFENTSLVDIRSYSNVGGGSLFDTIVALENYPLDNRLVPEGSLLSIHSYSISEMTHYDLSIGIIPFNEIEINFTFKPKCYDKDTIENLAGHFKGIIKSIFENSEAEINRLEIISSEEKNRVLYDYNNTTSKYPEDKTINELFVEQVDRIPDHIALVTREAHKKHERFPNSPTLPSRPIYLTYGQLNKQSNGLARVLMEKGVLEDNIVGIMMERSIEMVTGIFGILKAGGAYLPIDPGYPLERVNYMLRDSGAKLLVTTNNKAGEKVGKWESEICYIEELLRLSYPLTFLPSYLLNSSNLAYIIYTSGSTGKPKGVLIEHKSLVNRLFWVKERYRLNERDVILQSAPFIFDVSVCEMFRWIPAGGELCLLPPGYEKEPGQLIEAITRHRITTVDLVPSMLNLILSYVYKENIYKALSSLRWIFSGVEVVGINLVKHFNDTLGKFNKTRLINAYGPTESTVDVTYFDCSNISGSNEDVVPIGKPMANVKVYIIDKYGNLQPPGVFGELCIAGKALARGYQNNPDLTAEKFNRTNKPNKTYILYRTGDLARWLPNGNIEFLGRIDNMVKIRGFRIELGEIENRLLKHENIKEALVVAGQHWNDEKYLCAYIVPHSPSTDNIAQWRKYLRQNLPEYMVPAHFVLLEKMPLTNSGKIDRKSLPQPGPITVGEYLAPRNEIEKKLVNIWSKVLGLVQSQVGIDSNFFELGGHSLNATILAAKIYKELDVQVPLREIFERPTPRVQAEYIRAAKKDKYIFIEPVEKKKYYPLSSAQKRMYILHQLLKENINYNMSEAFILEGRMDVQRLEETFRLLIQRHESLRTSFRVIYGEPIQRVHDKISFKIETDSVKILENPGAFIRPFNLSEAPLLRVGLVEIKENRYLLVVDMHHIISDGTTVRVLTKEFMFLYGGGELPALRIQYKDYSEWLNSEKQIEIIKEQKYYWLRQFEGGIPLLELTAEYVRPVVQSFEGSNISFEIDKETVEALKVLTLETKSTLYMTLLAIYNILLSKLSSQEDIVVGSPAAGRRHADLQEIIGMFVNTLALRNYPVGEKTFTWFLSEVKEITLNAFENQDYPYEELVEQVVASRDVARNPLFDTMLVLQNVDAVEIDIPSLKLTPYNYENKTAKFDLTLTGMEIEDKLLFTWEYCTKLFKRETITKFSVYFKNMVNEVIRDKDRRIAGFVIITEEEKKRILFDFNDTESEYPKDKTIHRLFAEQVERTPDRVALIPACLTYGELNKRSSRVAHILIERGVLADNIVAIMIERSIEMIIGILGILKAGGTYLPIDPDYPQERIDYMLKDSSVKILLKKSEIRILKYETNPNDQKINDQNKSQHFRTAFVLNLDHVNFEFVSNFGFRISNFNSSNLAYIIYTSGTTGRPKGAMIEHRNVVRLMFNEKFPFDFNNRDIWTMFHSYCFDFSVWEMYGALLYGGKLIIIDKITAKDTWSYLEILKKEGVTVLNQTPSAFYNLANLELNSPGIELRTRYVIFGGEALTPSRLNDWQAKYPAAKLINMYGITETTVHVTFKEISNIEMEVTASNIGKPIPTLNVYIVDKSLELLPIGIAGELLVGGKGVGRGYLNQPELTAKKFGLLITQINKKFSGGPGGRFYKKAPLVYYTGDLCKWLPDGNIEFLGRIDHQVKIRGYRIELGEIEAKLSRHASIANAVAVVKEDENRNKNLCAYIVSIEPQPEHKLNTSQLREYLATELPDYMIPTYFVYLEKIPVTVNGKIDHKTLPNPQETGIRDNMNHIPPKNPIEKKLVETWERVLGRNNIGINDNFFEAGGDSIKAIQVMSRMNSAGYKIEMKDLFQYPVILDLAPHVKKSKRIPPQSVITGPIPLTPIQKMFFNRLPSNHYSFNHYNHFNQAVMLYSQEGFAKEITQAVFTSIQEHHDALRMTYKIDENSGKVIQIDHVPDYPLSLREYDLKNRETGFEELQTIVNEIQASIDLAKGPLMKLGLFHLDDGDRLLIVIHHLVVDGVSWRILFEDIETLYGHYKRGEQPVLPLKTDAFKSWSEKLSEYADSKTFLKEKNYWQTLCSVQVPPIPKDFEIADNYVKDTRNVSFILGEEETGCLLTQVNRAFKTEINDILLIALAIGIKRTFGHERMLIALEGHGREVIFEDMDISRTVGWFTSEYPIVIDLSHNDNLDRQIKEIKETLRKIPTKGIGYGILKYLTKEENKKEIEFKLKPQISFNYLGQFDADVSFEIAAEFTGNPQGLDHRRGYLLDINGITANNRLTMTISYNQTHFKPETITALSANFESELREMIVFCCSKKETVRTPSDFTYKGLSIASVDRLMESYLDIEDIYTLTPMQEGLLFYALAEGSAPFYFEQIFYRMQGELAITLVERSLHDLFKRHEILRTVFAYHDVEHPVQVILKERSLDFYYEDVKMADKAEQENYLNVFKAKDKERSFDLSKDVLMRLAILRVDNSQYEFVWSFHHIIMDGWSLGILNNEFFEIYTAYLENRVDGLPAVKPYRTYIHWLAKQDKEESARYWENFLDSFEEQTGLPGAKILTKEEKEYKNETVSIVLSREKTNGLNKLAAWNQVTLNIVTQTLWGILLGKYNGKDDVVFGAVVSGRPFELEGVESMVGLFINTIPVRIQFEGEMKLNTLLLKIQEQALASEPHHYHPLAEIQAKSTLKHNLIDHLFVFENYPLTDQIENKKNNNLALKLSNIDIFEQTNYDFNIVLAGTGELRILFQYNGSVYNRDYIERVAGHFLLAIDQVSTYKELEIRNLSFLSEEEKNRILYEFNNTATDYPEGKTIHELFVEQVEQTPDHMAVIFSSEQITYRELEEESNGLAYSLTEKGVQAETIVAIKVERCIEMVIGVFGILKSGGAYLPIDPDLPPDRVDYMLKDSRAKIIIGRAEFVFSCFFRASSLPRYLASASSNLAYIIYTSGSTGRPKGTPVEHRSLVNLCCWHNSYYGVTARDNAAQYVGFGFDVSVWDIFSYLIKGAVLHIISDKIKLNIEQVGLYFNSHHITIVFLPTQFGQAFIEEWPELRAMRALLIGGDKLNRVVATNYRLYNNYGPTENTVVTTVYSVESCLDNIPIGKPIANNRVYILAQDSWLPQPVGVPGELCISGVGLARGYLNNPELTAEKFGPQINPIEKTKIDKSFAGVKGGLFQKPPLVTYKTGDLACWLADGNIKFLGRIDHQVKIRGFRIELGEIENRLANYPGLKEVVVLAHEDKSKDKYLCAYIVSDKAYAASELREFAAKELPDYMVPSYFIKLERIPLNHNGKVDVKALPKPAKMSVKEFVAPRDAREKVLVNTWASVLGIDKGCIGISDNFFELGGHSLKATELVLKIHKAFNVRVPISEIFINPTIGELSAYIKEAAEERFAAIEPAEKKEYYELSSAQKRLYVLYQMDENSVVYNIPHIFQVHGLLENERLAKTFKKLVSRHECLKTTFHMINEEPVQRIHEHMEFEIEFKDLVTEDTEVKNFIHPFDLSVAPLLRAGLVKLEVDRHLLMMDMHHIISDGTSINIMVKDFIALYQGEDLPELRIQYKDFSEWQNNEKQRESIKQQKDFWVNEFKGEIPVLELPVDYARSALQSFEGSSSQFEIDQETKQSLQRLTLETESTLYIVLLAIYNMFLAKVTSQEDIVVGSPIAGRRHVDLEKIIGMFVNTLGLRNYPTGEKTFIEFLYEVKEKTLSVLENQDYQYEDLVDQVVVNRDVSRNPLVETMFVLQNMDIAVINTRDLKWTPYEYKNETAKFDLTLSGMEEENRLLFSFEYCTKLFREETIERFIVFFKNIAKSVTKNKDRRISEFEIITEAEKKRILFDFNDTWAAFPENKTIHELFAEQVVKTPDHIAVLGYGRTWTDTDNNMSITYRQLNEQSDRLAYTLIERGVLADDIVAIMKERVNDMIIGILGILKAGAAYLPLNPRQPEARTHFMLKDSGARILINKSEIRSPKFETNPNVKNTNDQNENFGIPFVSNLDHLDFEFVSGFEFRASDLNSSNLAYLIYTSGSTGNPKGVPINHANFSSLIHWGYRNLGINEKDRVIQNLSYYFDWSVWEIFIALTTGASLHMITEDILLNPEAEVEFILTNAITVLHITPTQYSYLLNIGKKLGSLKYLFIGAEKLTADLVEQSIWSVNNDCRVFNMYGPTEATIISAVLEIDKSRFLQYKELSSVPIGKPAAGLLLTILDKNMGICPVQIAGELYITGSGVARGYLNNPELTSEKFLTKSFWKSRPAARAHLEGQSFLTSYLHNFLPSSFSQAAEGILYKTGDLARWLNDGNIEFLGRSDYQVKIRGYRIEMGEIENRLLNIPGIKEAVVVVKGVNPEDWYLCSYIISEKKFEAAELREYLSRELPDYMIPSHFVYLEKMPLTANGKIDVRALPEPTIEIKEDQFQGPRDEVEEKMTTLWNEVLGVAKNLLTIDSDFFQMGGHSLKATILAAKIHKIFHVKVPLTEIFKTPTIRSLANYITASTKDRYISIEPVEKKEYYALSSAQQRLYVLHQLDEQGLNYNIPSFLILAGEIDKDRLEHTIKLLIRRHESLRTSFHMINDVLVQMVYDEVKVLGIKGLELGISRGASLWSPEVMRNFVRPFDLSKAPLLRIGLIKTGEKEHLMMVDMHHIISDGTSMNIVVRDFMALYQGENLAELGVQYKDFSEWQNNEKQREAIKRQEGFWVKQFEGELPVLELPLDYTRPVVQSFEGGGISFEIAQETVAALKKLTLETGATLYMILLAIYTIFLANVTNQEDIIIGSPVAGRRHADLEKIIGMFVNTLALRNFLPGEKTFRDYLEEVKINTLKAFENQEYPYEDLVERVVSHRDTSRNPLFDTMFILQNPPIQALEIPGLKLSRYEYENKTSKFDLTLSAVEVEWKLLFTFEYCTKLFRSETIDRFPAYFKNIMNQVSDDKYRKISSFEIITPEEKKQLLFDFNNSAGAYPKDKTIHQLFEIQVEKSPDRIAVFYHGPARTNTDNNIFITYCQLNEQSNRLAGLLIEKGVLADNIVAIMMERSIAMMIGIFGILKSGGAYLPIDPNYPEDRINYILKDSRAAILLIDYEKKKMINCQLLIVNCELLMSALQSPFHHSSFIIHHSSHLAYLIYTSGSTGKPKGVMIEHRSLVNYICWAAKTYVKNEKVNFPLYTSIAFDLTITSIFTPLITGQAIIIYNEEDSDSQLLIEKMLEDKKNIGVVKLTPAHLKLIKNSSFRAQSSKRFIVGGEMLDTQLARDIYERFKGNIEIYNEYGPTEATVGCMIYKFNPRVDQRKVVPIGIPAANVRIYILDSYFQPLPIGVTGELYISGDGLARGYLNNPELTYQKFFRGSRGAILQKSPPGNQMLYKTGDLAIWLPSGNIEFCGRNDHQVKIRGYRIETGEIEQQLLQHGKIKEAVVVVKKDSSGEKYMVAYFVSECELAESELRKYLPGKLPEYMIPSYFMRIEKIPLTSNGKLDHEALPQPGLKSGRSYLAPRTANETKLVELWSEILGRDPGHASQLRTVVGIDDNFFELGGHSLKATILTAKLRKAFNVDILLSEIFKSPTIRGLAHIITTAQKTQFIDLSPAEEKDYYDLSYHQKRLWFLQQMEPGNSAFNMPGRILLEHNVEAEWIEKILARVIERHEGFRTAFKIINGEPMQYIDNEAGVTLHKVDLSSLAEQEKQQERERIFYELASAPFDLTQAPLFRAGFVKLADGVFEFIFNMHHIISDGVSMEILKDEFSMLYQGYREGREVQLEPVTFQYKDFAAWHNQQLADSSLGETSLRYWRNKLENGIPTLELPGDFSTENGTNSAENKAAATWRFMINNDLKDKLKELARATHTTLFMALFSAYLLLLYRLSGREEIACSIIDSGREHPSLHRVIGFFINSLIFKTTVVEGETFADFLQRTRGDVLEVFQHRNYPLELVFEQLNMKYPDIPASFNLLNMQDNTLRDELTEFTPVHTDDYGEAKFAVEPYLCEYQNGIDIHWVYKKGLFKAETMAYIAEAYIKTLEEISQKPFLPVNRYRIFPVPAAANINGNLVRPVNKFPEFKKENTRQSIGQRFEAIVKSYPDKIAVKIDAAVISYDALNRFANRMARLIRTGQQQTVALIFNRSIEMLIGIIGVLKAGQTYVPLDPSYPKERLEYMLNDSQAGLIITNNERANLATVLKNTATDKIGIINIDKNRSNEDENPGTPVSPEELAYILYTSGSTGKPKGVMQNHGNVLHFARVYANALHLHPGDRLTLFSSYCFDAAKMDIFGALLNGATLYPFDIKKEENLSSLPVWLHKERITIFHAIPTVYRYFIDRLSSSPAKEQFRQLRLIVLGGEVVYKKDVDNYKRFFSDHCLFINGLGPTESTVTLQYFIAKETEIAKRMVPVGFPVEDTQVFILNDKGEEAQVFEVGEIVYKSAYLALGYWRDDEKTARVFTPDPLTGTDRVYRSGDLGRRLPNGNIEFMGRKDFRVKIRGFRVEIGEIETTLLQIGGIKEAAVVAKETEKGNTYLCAFFSTAQEFNVPELRKLLARELPDYMIPANYVKLEKMPLTQTGKIDRKALSLLKIEPLKSAAVYAKPQTEMEKIIAHVWKEILGLEEVGIHDNLLEIGGNSFDIIKINSKLSELLHEHIPIVKSFEYPTIEDLARYLHQHQEHKETVEHNLTAKCDIKQRGISLEIAVIGMAGRFPGARNITEFWENLKNGVESISFFTEDELLEAGLPSESIKRPNYIKAKGMVEDIELFDAAFFNFTPAEAIVMDPQLRIFHECCWETFEHAGYNPFAYDGAIGVYAGNAFNIGWLALVFSQTDATVNEFEKGILNNHISTYISYKLNLTGPSVTIRTACSTSLVAVHEACKGLLLNECDMAMAGGVSILVPKKAGYLYQAGMIYSSDGHIRTFDAHSQGTVFGDGVGCVLLKRLPDAISDGDRIYAVIKGSAINNDGIRKPGYTASSTAGQRDVVRAAQMAAKCEPESITFIETHGAGTILGDAVEIEALKQVFPQSTNKYCALASVKTNVGHLNAAAGITGFIKTVLSLKYKLIPPSLNFETPNPEINFENSPFYVNTKLTEWKNNGHPLRAGVSSFGLGGTNAHVVLEEYQGQCEQKKEQFEMSLLEKENFMAVQKGGGAASTSWTPAKTFHIILLSAKSQSALEKQTRNLTTYFDKNPEINLSDVSFTLQMGRKTFHYKKMLVCRTAAEAVEELTKNTKKIKTSSHKGDPPPIIFIISGQGGQYVNMGKDLYTNEPLFRQEMDRSFEILKPLLNCNLKDVLYDVGAAPDGMNIDQPEVALAVNFVFEYSLARFLMQLGINPTAMTGYSFGEYAAACLANVLSWEEALKLIFARGLLMRKTHAGSMLSVPLPEHEIRPLLAGSNVSLAINNGTSCVVAGPVDDVKSFEKRMHEKRLVCVTLNMSHAAHSPLMNPIRKEFEEKVQQVKLNKPQIPYISNVTGTWITEGQAIDPSYWGEHLCSPVRFSDGIAELLKIERAVFIEIGPGRLLSNIIRQSFSNEAAAISRKHKIINMIKHQHEKQPDDYYFLNKIGELWLYGVPIDWRAYYKNEKCFRVPLPTYPFDRKRFWIEGAGLAGKLELITQANVESTEQMSYRYESDNENYEAPRDELETNIAEVWEKILGFERIGIHDNFYEMNGDSLTATQMATRLQEVYPVEIPLRDFLEKPTIAQLAELIKDLLVQKLENLSGEELDALAEEDIP